MKNVIKGADIHTLNLFGRQRSSLTLIDRPMSVAMLQWGMVGVNSTSTAFSPSFTCKTQSSLVWLFGVTHFYKYKVSKVRGLGREEREVGAAYFHSHLLHDIEFLQRKRMFRVVDGSDQM